ncbi:hypothetical protein LPJ61_003226 [Coemansia biformis]|uniref:Uncharacterized protein n=1 Tax=Coemansia biformis TaxID=1286918 RepID=A0A9W8CYF3_9FUNG|nr:hypothetical protein LPJ61_003226 [Coemansia biformis]
MGLIAAAGCKDMVKCVTIKVNFLDSPITGLTRVIENMHEVAGEWKKVSELTISMVLGSFHHDYSDLIIADYRDDICKVGNALAALMPELRQAFLGGENTHPIATAICSYLAEFYTEQMQVLYTQYPITTPSGHRFKCLKNASINYDNLSGYHPPSMDVADLEVLNLYNAPANHSWTPFSTNDDSYNIEFTKLKQLCIGYHAMHEENGIVVPHRDGHPWRLCFPNLEILSIMCTKSICPLLEYMVLPSHMNEITIKMKLEHFQHYAAVSLPAANKIVLKVYPFSIGEPIGLPAINRILDSVRGSDNVELEIMKSTIPVLPGDITSTTITRLLVAGPTSVDTMFELIQRLPNLVGLILYKLDMDSVQTDISVPEAGEHTPVEPYDTKLTGMAINYMQDKHSPDLAAAIAKHLLLKIPTLSKFFACQTPVRLVHNFIETYSQWYPHLSSINFRLRDDEYSDSTTWIMQMLY